MNLSDFQEWDEIILTGASSSPYGRYFVEFKCMIASISNDAIKVWHLDENDPQLTKEDLNCGKFWFEHHKIESITLIRRDL